MKQESVNTFSGGLTYDINPLTTPNTILSDCVNGTFITFNGDELALQNDAGNTKIMVPGTEEDPQYVQLSEGFYPLGIKEYGGVLYIVSGKYPTIVPTEWSIDEIYLPGDVVYQDILNVRYYYEGLSYNNWGNILPYETNEFWLIIGTEKDFINRHGEIEFGSYPSPEVVDSEQLQDEVFFTITNTDTLSNLFKFKLYSPQIINNSIFQAGVYVSFNSLLGSALNTDNISFFYIDGGLPSAPSIQNKKIYKVKLYHQLTNGFIDLTTDVWNKYASFVKLYYGENLNSSGDPRFWFLDSNFKYYCPHNYKGKLVLSVELEELDLFKGRYLDITIEEISGVDYYNIFFPILYENTTMWNNIYSNVSIFYTTDNSVPKLYINPTDSNNTTQKIENLPIDDVNLVLLKEDYENKILNYKIIPEFSVGENKYIPFEEYLPQEFIDKHTLVGGRVIVTGAEEINVTFKEEDIANSYCAGDYRKYPTLTLVDGDGNFIDGFGDIQTEPYQFYEEGFVPIPTHPLGTYVIGDQTNPISVSPEDTEIAPGRLEYITSLVRNSEVYRNDFSCVYRVVVVYVNTIVVTEIPFTYVGTNNIVSVVQDSSDFKKYIITYIPTNTITLTPKESLGFDSSYTTTLTDIDDNIMINFALVSKINIRKEVILTGENLYTVKCFYETLSVTYLPSSNYETTLENIAYYQGTITPVNLGGGFTGHFYIVNNTDETRANGDYIFNMQFISPLTGDIYSNIIDTNFSKVGENNYIFPTTYTITAQLG